MYNTIVNPETGRKVKVNGKLGQRILNNYILQYGGNTCKETGAEGKTYRYNHPVNNYIIAANNCFFREAGLDVTTSVFNDTTNVLGTSRERTDPNTWLEIGGEVDVPEFLKDYMNIFQQARWFRKRSDRFLNFLYMIEGNNAFCKNPDKLIEEYEVANEMREANGETENHEERNDLLRAIIITTRSFAMVLTDPIHDTESQRWKSIEEDNDICKEAIDALSETGISAAELLFNMDDDKIKDVADKHLKCWEKLKMKYLPKMTRSDSYIKIIEKLLKPITEELPPPYTPAVVMKSPE